MAEVGLSTRFRSIALTVLAAGGIFLPVAALTVGSLGLLPTTSTAETTDPAIENYRAASDAYGASGILPQTTELSPSLQATIVATRDTGPNLAVGIPNGALTIPPAAMAAYQRAEHALALQQPECKVGWTLLAGLGRVISDHGGGSLDPAGNSTRPILGPRLDGSPGLANIRDTDDGRIDGDTQRDRASGPLQIIPEVWRRVAADSDGDGLGSPHNVFDAALAAGRYLCEGDADLAEVFEQARAVFRYQRSDVFVRAVMTWTLTYEPRIVPGEPLPVTLPPVEEIRPLPDTLPPPGSFPQGEPQAPASAIRPPGPPPPPSMTRPRPDSPSVQPPPGTITPRAGATTPPSDHPPPGTTMPSPRPTTPRAGATTPPSDSPSDHPPPDMPSDQGYKTPREVHDEFLNRQQTA